MSTNVQLLLIDMVSMKTIKFPKDTNQDMLLDQIHNCAELKRLLADIDAPLRRMDNNLKDIQDNLQGEFSTQGINHSLMDHSIQAHGNFTVDVARTIHSTSRADEAGCAFRNRAMASL